MSAKDGNTLLYLAASMVDVLMEWKTACIGNGHLCHSVWWKFLLKVFLNCGQRGECCYFAQSSHKCTLQWNTVLCKIVQTPSCVTWFSVPSCMWPSSLAVATSLIPINHLLVLRYLWPAVVICPLGCSCGTHVTEHPVPAEMVIQGGIMSSHWHPFRFSWERPSCNAVSVGGRYSVVIRICCSLIGLCKESSMCFRWKCG